MPQDCSPNTPRDFQYAYQLIEEIKAQGDFWIGAACYPEGHVECPSKEMDIDHLKRKVESGCDFLTRCFLIITFCITSYTVPLPKESEFPL